MMHDFGVVWSERALMLSGLANTTILSALSAAAALVLGAGLAPALMSKTRVIAFLSRGFVDGMRCVPFLLFAYIVYYGLPSLGLSLSNWSSGLFALIVYNTAYMAELLRGAWKELPRDTIDAGTAFGFHGIGLLRIVLPPVFIAAVPMLGNQFIQIIKDSAFLVIIAVEELTYAANEIQATYYVPFASFVCAVLGYWMLCLIVEGGVRFFTEMTAARR